MKVFISWSKPRSKAVAELVREYVPKIVQAVEPFMSQHDIMSGEQWSVRIAEELSDTSFGIFCLTPENINQPWLLYEAGAISKLKGNVAGLFIAGLQPTNFNNPLSQFQHRHFDNEGFRKLILDVANSAGVKHEKVDSVFEAMWPQIEVKYNAILDSILDETPHKERTFRRITP